MLGRDIQEWLTEICNRDTQKVVAAKAGVSQDQISRLKNSEIIGILARLMMEYGVSVVSSRELDDWVIASVTLAKQVDRMRNGD